jgi:hypothetical protein
VLSVEVGRFRSNAKHGNWRRYRFPIRRYFRSRCPRDAFDFPPWPLYDSPSTIYATTRPIAVAVTVITYLNTAWNKKSISGSSSSNMARQSVYPSNALDLLSHLDDCVNFTEAAAASLQSSLGRFEPGIRDLPRLSKILCNNHVSWALPF